MPDEDESPKKKPTSKELLDKMTAEAKRREKQSFHKGLEVKK